MIGQRLKQLRLARGLSQEALASTMGGVVTKQAISKYERGKTQPSRVMLNRLAAALGVKAVRLWNEPTYSVEFIAYRKGSRLPKKAQAQVESLVSQQLEERIRLQDLTQQIDDQTNEAALAVQALEIGTIEDAEVAAEELRRRWNLGLDPIASVTGVLEDHHVHVLEMENPDLDNRKDFHGISATAYDDEGHVRAAAVVTPRGAAGERQRFSLMHELGHLVMSIPDSVDEEKAVNRFSGAFLAPADVVRQEVGVRRALITLDELLLFKQRFGISLQSLLFRLRDLGIITESHYIQWCRRVSRSGWKKEEPQKLPPERPQWLRHNVLRAASEGLMTRKEAEALLGEVVDIEEPLSLIERRAFMKLPIQERRRIMAEQAEKMVAYYEEDTELKEFQGGDIVE